MSVVEIALKRPYTVVAVLILISLMGIGAALRMPIDIFPEINIPVVAVVWTYNGMSAQDMQNRILTLHERQLASLVDDISRIEAVSYQGVGVEKVYLHEGADVSRAISQLASSALVVLKYMPPNITPPLVLRYGATDVPIIQLSLSSKSLPDTKLNDLGQNIIRPALAVVHGAEVPYPYGGKPRVIMADLDSQALQARGLSAADVSAALQRQNVILPSGDVKIGDKDYTLAMNNSPDLIDTINAFPIKEVDGRTIFMRDVAHVHDGFQVQTNSVSVNGTPGALMTIRKTGGVSTLAVIDGVRAALTDIKKVLPPDVTIKPLFDQSVFVKAALNSVGLSAGLAAALTALVIILFLGNMRLSLIILAAIPLSIITAVLFIDLTGQTLEHPDARRLCTGDRYLGRQRHGGHRKHRAARRHERTVAPVHRRRRQRSCRTHISVDLMHLHRLRAGISSTRHGEIFVLAAIALRDGSAPRQPRAVIHHGAGAVQHADARIGAHFSWRSAASAGGRSTPRRRISWCAFRRASNADSSLSGTNIETHWLGRCPNRSRPLRHSPS